MRKRIIFMRKLIIFMRNYHDKQNYHKVKYNAVNEVDVFTVYHLLHLEFCFHSVTLIV